MITLVTMITRSNHDLTESQLFRYLSLLNIKAIVFTDNKKSIYQDKVKIINYNNSSVLTLLDQAKSYSETTHLLWVPPTSQAFITLVNDIKKILTTNYSLDKITLLSAERVVMPVTLPSVLRSIEKNHSNDVWSYFRCLVPKLFKY